MKNKIKYAKNVTWIIPFVESVAHLVPLHKIQSIKGYTVRKGTKPDTDGSTIRRGKKYNINLCIYVWSKKQNKYITDPIGAFLDTLAHELSHVCQTKKEFGKHDYKHFGKQALILKEFSNILNQLGIDDTSRAFNNLL